MTGNQTHSVNNSNYQLYFNTKMQAYDALPLVLRVRISQAHFTISSKTIYIMYQYSGNIEMCLKAIDQIEEQMELGVI